MGGLNKKAILLLSSLIVILLAINSCSATREGKRIKKGSGVIQDSKILLRANWEGTVAFLNIDIRENYFFDIRQYGMFISEYYAGTYSISEDTVHLNFIDNHNPGWLHPYVIISNNNLLIPWDDPERSFNEIPIIYNVLTRF